MYIITFHQGTLNTTHFAAKKLNLINGHNCTLNKATRLPEISRKQVQKLTPQFLLYIYWI